MRFRRAVLCLSARASLTFHFGFGIGTGLEAMSFTPGPRQGLSVGGKLFLSRARRSESRVERRTSDCPAVTVPLRAVLQSSPEVRVVPRILSDESNDVTRLTVLYSRLPQGEVRRRASGRPRSGFLKKVVRRNDATGRLSAAR